MGSVTPRVAFAAIAASIADPPRASTCAPATDACTWLVATIPYRLITIDRAWERSPALAHGPTQTIARIHTQIARRSHLRVMALLVGRDDGLYFDLAVQKLAVQDIPSGDQKDHLRGE